MQNGRIGTPDEVDAADRTSRQITRFDPALIEKYKRRFPDFDEKIIALYARGMSTRDIQTHVGERYGVTISPDLVSVVTDS